jgi:hypothetical protein
MQRETEWGGTFEEVNGVIVVKNPVDPMYGEEAFDLEEELVIGEAEGQEEYMFQGVYSVAISDIDDIYVLDYRAQHVKVFNNKGEYLRTIGRPGQGPGELFLPRSLIFTSQDEVVVGNMNNITYFTPEGTYIKSIPLTRGSISTVKIDGDGNIFGFGVVRDKGVYELKKFDTELNELHSLGTSPLPSVEFRRTRKRNVFFTLLRWDIINSNQIVSGYPEEGYIINTYDSSGNLVRKIEKEYTRIEITDQDFEEEIAEYPPAMKEGATAPKHFPPFQTLFADDEGRVYVLTHKRTADRRYYYDVFDADGRYILKVPLKARPRVKKNKMYTIEEDEEGFQYIKRYKITWNF